MIVTLQDRNTGATRRVDDVPAYQWAEGNWSCDCNRASYFDIDIPEGVCAGSHRFIVISVEDVEPGYDLLDFNQDYIFND